MIDNHGVQHETKNLYVHDCLDNKLKRKEEKWEWWGWDLKGILHIMLK